MYICDEAFFTGTAAHVAPIIEIDERPVGDGSIGPISKRLQEIYFRIIEGNYPKYMHWCTPVMSKVSG
jgi:branched-chain amino acid aminotransferase